MLSGKQTIASFAADRMNAYLAGGMKPETAADFTRGELTAIYRRNHYSRDTSGAMRLTPMPENLYPATAMEFADAILTEILNACTGNGAGQQAPATTPRAVKRNGLEGLKNYVKRRPI